MRKMVRIVWVTILKWTLMLLEPNNHDEPFIKLRLIVIIFQKI